MATKLDRSTLEVVKNYFDIIGNIYATPNTVTIELKGYKFTNGNHIMTFNKGEAERIRKALTNAAPCACSVCFEMEWSKYK